MDALADVGINAPSLFHRRHDGGEVVIGEDHVRRPLGHVGAGLTHGAADVRHLQGGGIVDPIAGHGHHLTGTL